MQTVTCFAQTGTNRQMRLWPTTVKAAAVRPSAHISPASMCWPAGGVHLAAASASSAAAAQGPFYLPHGPHVFSGAWFGAFFAPFQPFRKPCGTGRAGVVPFKSTVLN